MPPDEIATRKPGAPPAREPPPGTVLGGRYEVLGPGAGGVLLGRDTATLGSVTITAVEDGLVSAAAGELILRHVVELQGLPGLAAPIYAGRDGAWFVLVSGLVHGVALAERLTHGGLPAASALAVARDLLRGLGAAHGRGLLHLAVAPSSVMVNPDGRVRQATLTGFGAAVLRDCVAELDAGDVGYAAPEQAGVLDRPVDHRSDLYSLGLVLHECLTGRPAYAAATDGELLRRRLTDRPPSLRPERPEVPAALEAEILRMLAVDPDDRPAGAAEVLLALAGAGAGAGEEAHPGTGSRRSPAVRGARPGPVGDLIGRDAELTQLLAHLRTAGDGRGGAVLLEGAPGIGKTRLLDELAGQAAAQGALVLRGRAPEHPPTPAGALDGLVSGLLDLAAGDPDLSRRLRAAVVSDQAAASLAGLLPRLGPLLEIVLPAVPRTGRPQPVLWEGAGVLAGLLAGAGSRGSPVVVILDDCQWADAAVFELIAAWGPQPPGVAPRHAVLVAAYRPHSLSPDHPLRQIAAIGRIPVGPLEDAVIADVARAADAPPDAASCASIVAAADGNPARAELAAGCLREDGDLGRAAATPGDGLAARRGLLLPEDVRKLLGAGALLGRDFSPETAAAALGRGTTWTALAQAEAERRQILTPAPDADGHLAFRQDELRVALAASIPDREARRLHARLAELSGHYPDDSVYPAAWHAAAAGDPARAAAQGLAAAGAAVAREAPDVAEFYLRGARRHAPELAPELALEIVEQLAAVHLARGRTDLAEEQLAEAARIARRCAVDRPGGPRPMTAQTADAGRPRRRLRWGLRPADRRAGTEDRAGLGMPVVGDFPGPAGGTGASGQRTQTPPAPGPAVAMPSAPDRVPAARPARAGIDERLATLLAGGRGISSALSREAIFDAVREVALPLLEGGRVVIVHLAATAGQPVVSGYTPACEESLARVCRGLAVRAAVTGQALAFAPAQAAELAVEEAAVMASGVAAAICAPIVIADRVSSCIYVDRSAPAGSFGADELRLAEFVAAMAATALENAEGFAKVESLSRSLEQRVEERTAQLADSNRQLDLSLQRLTEAFERERASAAELKHQAFHDSLTDLANRALFSDRVEHALEVGRRAEHGVAVLFVDLDDFKTVNDSLGHPAGDELLVAVAGRLREVLRRADTAARLGGDEFAILLEASDREGAVRTAERILRALEIPFKLAAKEVFVHASIGIALTGAEEISVDSLLRNADVAMYIAKTGGKRSFEVFEQRMHDEIVRRLELKDDLHRGIELNQFAVHYQPIVDIATSRIHGLEALIRWNHPVHGMISPLDFVPLAEETGMIRAIGDWVLRTACQATRGWQEQEGHVGERLTIGVNLSARELHEPGLVDCVAAALSGSGLAPADLTLEITESVLMNDTQAAIARLRELKGLGVRLAIDDFGTGYSSLSYLKDLPVDIVKIAKPFVDDIAHGPQEAALAGAIVALSETLRLKTVAEGIEEPDQLRALQRLGCDFGQGYLFARPMAAADTAALLSGDRRFPVVGQPGLRLLRAV